jgi:hypothetical protein
MMNEAEKSSPATTKRALWRSHVEKWKESRLSQEAYCQATNINYNTFVYWRGVLLAESRESGQQKFAAVKVTQKMPELRADAPKAIQIKLLSGHVVYLPFAIGMQEITVLLQSLGHINA